MEVGQRKKIHDLRKHGLASEEEDRAAVHICREKTRKAKAHLESTPASVVLRQQKRLFQVHQQQEEVKGKHKTDA